MKKQKYKEKEVVVFRLNTVNATQCYHNHSRTLKININKWQIRDLTKVEVSQLKENKKHEES